MTEEYILETQRILGNIIKKPKLVEKLLAKPPFRFIHDITKSIISETGFLDGLFSEDELNADNIQDKEGKLNFLGKLITGVENAIDTKLPTKASKIAAGLEPENTNFLLQKLGEAATKKSSSGSSKKASSSSEKKESSSSSTKKSSSRSSPEKSRKGSDSPEKSRRSAEPEKEKERDRERRKTSDSPEKRRKDESPERRRRDDDKTSSKEREKSSDSKEDQKKKDREEREREKEKERERAEREKEKEKERAERAERDKEKERERAEREKEKERERAEREKEKEREKEREREKAKKEEEALAQAAAAAAAAEENEADLRQRNARPVTARRAPPKQQTNVRVVEKSKSDKVEATVAAPQVITEGTAKDDEDLIVKVEAKIDDDAPLIQDDNEQHGMLVKNMQSTNKELQRGARDNGKATTKIRDTKEMAKEKLQKELEQVRESIQALTRGANPLGKCVDFVPEDIESMDKELEAWKAENIKQTQLVEEEERLTEQSLQPFYTKMNDLDIQIKEQLAKIHTTKAKLIENDGSIQQMLYMVVKA